MALITLLDAQLAFGHVALLDHAQFSLESGERVGLIGRNGAGKSSLLKILGGLAKADDGQVQTQSGIRITYVAQEPVLVPEQTIFESASAGIAEVIAVRDRYLAGAEGEDLDALQSQIEAYDAWNWEQRVEETLQRLHLDPEAVVGTLSGGMKKRVALAQALVARPDVLLLDEPTNHLDLEMRLALTMALQEFSGAVLVVSHDRHLLKSTTDNFFLVADGKVEEFDGDLEDYARWLVDYRVRQAAPNSAESNLDKTDKRAQRQVAAALRQQLAPHKRETDKLEKELGQLHAQLAAVEQRLGDSAIYEAARKDELRDALAEQARLKSREADLEERWMLALETLEALQAELEAAS